MLRLLSAADFYSLRNSSQLFALDELNKDKSKTLSDFVQDIAALYTEIHLKRESVFLIFSEDPYEFIVMVCAALLAKKKVFVLNNSKYTYVKDLLNDDSFFLSDTPESQLNTFLLQNASKINAMDCSILQGLKIDSSNAIGFYTSGSTGHPKLIEKKLVHLENEVEQLASYFHHEIIGSLFLSSVFHYHFYGFLFYFLLPLAVQSPISKSRINYLETCTLFSSWKKITLVSSPAFLKRIVKIPFNFAPCWTIFSSAGLLEAEASANCLEIFNTEAIEVYGSTETGGIAWRRQKANPLWKPFSCIDLHVDAENRFTLRSPYFDGMLEGGDFIKYADDGFFTLLGRVDSTVKIEGRRIDLKDIDSKIASMLFCSDCYTIYYKKKRREQIVSFITLKKDSALYELNLQNELAVKKRIQDYLSGYFDKPLLPKKIYILESMPKNAMGKIDYMQLETLLNPSNPFYEYAVQSIQTAENCRSAQIDISFPDTSSFFQGHFDGFPLLPGVAQIKTAFDISKKLFSHSFYIKASKKIKYTNMIHPNTPLKLSLDFFQIEKKLSFCFYDENKNYSFGNLILGVSNE